MDSAISTAYMQHNIIDTHESRQQHIEHTDTNFTSDTISRPDKTRPKAPVVADRRKVPRAGPFT